MNRTPLAYQLFENIIEDLSDKQLSELNTDLLNYKEKYQRSYRELRRHPFIGDLFGLIHDQIEYRNQMDEDLENLLPSYKGSDILKGDE